MNRVTIGISVDETFLKALRANVNLSGLNDKDELQPIDQLALVAYLEFRGALEDQVHAAILPVWRPHIHAVSELRKREMGDWKDEA